MSMELISREDALREADYLILETSYDNEKVEEMLKELPTVKAIPIERLEQIKQEVKEWYWNHDIQYLAKDPCVVDAMTDMFIRMLDKAIKEHDE